MSGIYQNVPLRITRYGLLLGMCAAIALTLAGAKPVVRLRAPAVAGTYYPAEPEKLRTAIGGYFDAAHTEPQAGRLLACIAPHAAIGFAGEVMAHAFNELEPDMFDRVVVLAPSNMAEFFGCSIPAVGAYLTPLGAVRLDQEAIRQLTFSPHISLRSVRSDERGLRKGIHEREFAIEVLLPFLQARLGNTFKLVPMVVGQLARPNRQADPNTVKSVVESLERITDDRTLVVVSSNFTQYGEIFQYVPFDEQVYAQIENLDRLAFDYILDNNVSAFRQYLQITRNPIAGQVPIEILMRLLPDAAEGVIHKYVLSGRLLKSEERSVSYAAINFYSAGASPDDGAQTGEEP